MKFAQELIRFGEQLSEESNAACDLWSWLPSHKVAEKHHGDYAVEHSPSNRDVMVEAAMYLGYLKHPEVPLTFEEQEWFERCPCGENHVESTPESITPESTPEGITPESTAPESKP
jgi:hypothetical protein